jgi:phosphate transport system permease protein
LGYGGVAITQSTQTIFSFVNNSTGQAFMNTLLIIIIAIGVGLPLSLMIAIYLNEFAKEGKIKKTLLFFIDSLGATPSILFGMFGLIFFIQTVGLSAGGTAGKSIIAGSLTILIVILPVFIRTIQQALQSIPKELRTNSYALGAGKWETIKKIVLPAAKQGITTAVVLSIGRILAETAPLYLTSGLASSSSISLMNPGQTLTTRIYAQIYTANVHDGTSIMYECAFVTLILVLLIILMVHVAIPAYYNHKRRKIIQSSKRIRLQQETFERSKISISKVLTKQDFLKRTTSHKTIRKRKQVERRKKRNNST